MRDRSSLTAPTSPHPVVPQRSSWPSPCRCGGRGKSGASRPAARRTGRKHVACAKRASLITTGFCSAAGNTTICATMAPNTSCALLQPGPAMGGGLIVPTLPTWPGLAIAHDSKEEDWITIGSRDNSVVHAHGRGMTSVFPCVRVQLSPLLTAVLFREDRIPKLRGTPTNLASMADRERS
jgi:hypothetical protein